MALESNSLPPARRFQYASHPAAQAAPDVSPRGSGAPMSLPPLPSHDVWQATAWSLAVAALCMVFFYPANVLHLVERWSSDAGWSHGFVVPLISLFFIRMKWEQLRQLTPA